MTEPVKEVSRSGGIDRDGKARQRIYHGPAGSGADDGDAADDSVDISDEARKRASGSWKKDILEYLGDDS